ncbi:hypothetical protein OC834_006715 [Tilletia horrida]|nr:hypothetical protein OC834_006715 [Tilletia horrida]
MKPDSQDGLRWTDITYDIPLARKQRKAAIAAAASAASPNGADSVEKGVSSDLKTGQKDGAGPTLKPGDRRILNNISGHVARGEMLAILGASGAGKTTLQSILSARLGPVGTLHGSVTFDGKPRDKETWKRSTAFVEQEDVLIGELTVEETIRFAARLRLPNRAYTRAQKDERADHVLDMVRLNAAAQTPIGSGTTRGVSGGERKRVSIACELVTEPALLMLDEPTSGLDSFSSFQICQNLRSITKAQNISTLLTIHQPSFAVFCLADRVMLLARGGVFYDGPPGEEAAEYFASLGYVPGEGVNPADYYLELVSNLERNEEGEARTTRLLDAWQEQLKKGPILPKNGKTGGAKPPIPAPVGQDGSAAGPPLDATQSPASDETRVLAKDAPLPTKESADADTETDADADAENGPGSGARTPAQQEKSELIVQSYATWPLSWPEELAILLQRSMLQQLRNRELWIGTQAQSIVLLIVIGLAFLRLGLTSSDVLARIGALFVIPTNASFAVLFPIISIFPLQRQVMLRERSAGVYRISAFYFSKVFTEIPAQLVQRALFYIVVYWMIGFQPSRFGVWIAINFLQVACSVALGLFIGSISPSLNVANIIAPLINVLFLLFAPTLLPNPPPWFVWIRYISPLTYSVMALIQNEMRGLKFQCNGEPQCYSTGEAVISSYNVGTFTIAECAGFLFAITFVLLLLGYLGLRFIAKPRFRYTSNNK